MVGHVIYMQKIIFFTLFFWICPLLGQAQLPIKKTSPKVIQFNTRYPVVISLANAKDGGSWALKKDEVSANKKEIILSLIRQGYLFSYFILKPSDHFKGILTFEYNVKGKITQERQFYIEANSKVFDKGNPLFGDTPPESKGKNVFNQVNNSSQLIEPSQNIKKTSHFQEVLPQETNFSPQKSLLPNNFNAVPSQIGAKNSKESEKENTVSPEYDASKAFSQQSSETVPISQEMKAYLNNLIRAGLFEQARIIFDAYTKQNPPDNEDWKNLTDINISLKGHQFQEVVNKASALFNEDNSPKVKMSQETQFTIRENLAQAYEKLNQPNQAEAQWIYLQTYFKNNPYADYNISQFYWRQKKFDKAVTYFTKLIQETPNFPHIDEVYFDLGNYYYSIVGIDGYHLSLNYYKKVLTFGPSSSFYSQAKEKVDYLEHNFFNL